MAPMNHVWADGVGPVHISPNRGVRVVLKKHVVSAFPINGPVGDIHPVLRGKQMKLRTQWVGGKSLLQRLGVRRSESERRAKTGGSECPEKSAAFTAHQRNLRERGCAEGEIAERVV